MVATRRPLLHAHRLTVAVEHGRIFSWPVERIGRIMPSCHGGRGLWRFLRSSKTPGTTTFIPQLLVGPHALNREVVASPNQFIDMPLATRKTERFRMASWPDGKPAAPVPRNQKISLESLQASLLYCPRCRVATPRENGCCWCFRQATCTSTSASNVEPRRDPRPNRNAAGCCIRRASVQSCDARYWGRGLEDLVEWDTFFDQHHGDIFTIGYRIFRSALIKPPSSNSVTGFCALFFNTRG
jgi:hypothetical protein